MKKAEVKAITERCLSRVSSSADEALDILKLLITQKLHFPLFDYAGKIIGEKLQNEPKRLFVFLDAIEATKAMGGYVVLGSSLAQSLGIWKSLPPRRMWERLPSLDKNVGVEKPLPHLFFCGGDFPVATRIYL